MGEILTPVIRDGNLFVLEFSVMLKHIGKVGRNVQDVLNAILAQDIQVGGIFGTAQIQIGENLDRKGRLIVWNWAPL